MPASLARRAATGAAWVTVETVGVQLLSLVVFAVLARLLTPDAFGLASIGFVLVNSCKIVLFDSVATIVARKEAGTDLEYSTAFWLTVSISIMAFAGLQLFSIVSGRIFSAPHLAELLRALSVMLLVQGMARTQEVWMLRHFQFRALAMRGLLGALAGGLTGIGAALLGWGVWALVLQQVVTSLGGLLLLWSACPWRPRAVFSVAAARDILTHLGSTSGGSLAYAFNQNCDTILIGLAFGPGSVGIYSVAKRLRLALQLAIATPINSVTMPALAEVQADPARFTQVLLTATSVVFAIAAPAFLGAAAVGEDLIRLAFGPQWTGAAAGFAWLAAGALLTIAVDYNNTVFLIRGRPVWTLYMALLNVAISLTLFAVARSANPAWVALPFVMATVAVLPVSVLLLRRLLNIRIRAWARAALPPVVAAAVMVALIQLAQPGLQGWTVLPRLCLLIGGGALVYGAALTLLDHRLVQQIAEQIRPLLRRRARSPVT